MLVVQLSRSDLKGCWATYQRIFVGLELQCEGACA